MLMRKLISAKKNATQMSGVKISKRRGVMKTNELVIFHDLIIYIYSQIKWLITKQ